MGNFETDTSSLGYVKWKLGGCFSTTCLFLCPMVFCSGGCFSFVVLLVLFLCLFGSLKQLTNFYMNVFNAEDFRFGYTPNISLQFSTLSDLDVVE